MRSKTLTRAAGLPLPAVGALAVEVVEQVSTDASVLTRSRAAVVDVCATKTENVKHVRHVHCLHGNSQR